MARPLRIEYEGAAYHVGLRGNERRPILKTDADRERFLNTLSESIERVYDKMSGTLPNGLNLNLPFGTLAGTPTEPRIFRSRASTIVVAYQASQCLRRREEVCGTV